MEKFQKNCRLITLERRKERGDLIETDSVFKSISLHNLPFNIGAAVGLGPLFWLGPVMRFVQSLRFLWGGGIGSIIKENTLMCEDLLHGLLCPSKTFLSETVDIPLF